MTKIFFVLMITISLIVIAVTACKKEKSDDKNYSDDKESVVINGVRWATRNVDMPGTFAANPESSGMLYQWNRKIGWSATEPMINSNGGTIWDPSCADGDWEKANDPSPAGYRISTAAECVSLFDTSKVNVEYDVIYKGVKGWAFTDKSSGASIFLPFASHRGPNSGELWDNYGSYWGDSTQLSDWGAGFFGYGCYSVNQGNHLLKSFGRSVRPVAE